tara:strand:- start:29 stop:202 length:174 start_codon:yes stop_codon:yes gene_type:complete
MTIPLLGMHGDELMFNGEKIADISPLVDENILKKFEYWLEFVTDTLEEELADEYDPS